MKKKLKTTSLRKKIIAIVSLLGLVLVISTRMYQGFQVDLMMKDLHQLEEERKKILSETSKLRAEVNRLKNVDRISRIAAEKFDLVINNDPVTMIRIENFETLNKVKRNFADRKNEQGKISVAGVY
jgi:cell division protein FtsL